MKNTFVKIGLILLISLIVFGIADAKKKSPNGTGKIKFVENIYDFGKIQEKGGLVTHEFQFVNEGDGNLIILDAKAECGCTRPSYSDAPVAPGKTGKLKVSYNPLGRPGSFDKTVTVTTSGNPRKVRVKIRGVVVEK